MTSKRIMIILSVLLVFITTLSIVNAATFITSRGSTDYGFDIWSYVHYSNNTSSSIYLDEVSLWVYNDEGAKINTLTHQVFQGVPNDPNPVNILALLHGDQQIGVGEYGTWRWQHGKTYNKGSNNYVYITTFAGKYGEWGSQAGWEVIFEGLSIKEFFIR